MPKFLYTDPFVCTGCRICELVCSVVKYGHINPSLALVKVFRELNGKDYVMSCRNCGKPVCVQVCHEKAIFVANGLVKIKLKKCNGCGICAEKCPFHAIKLYNKKACKCDLCGKCIEFCPTKGLTIKGG